QGKDFDQEGFVRRVLSGVVEPILKHKASLLAELDKLDFDTDAQKAAFESWVRSAGKLRSGDELRVIHECAKEQAELFKNIARNPSMSPSEITQAFCGVVPSIKQKLDDYIDALVKSGKADDFGTDDKNAEMGRVISMACSLAENGNPPLDDQQQRSLFETFNSEPMRSEMSMHLNLLESLMKQVSDIRDRTERETITTQYGAYATLVNMMVFSADAMARNQNARFLPPDQLLDPSFMSARTRDAVTQLSAAAGRLLADSFPARPSFPAPAQIENMPSTDAGRREFLNSILDSYLPREKEHGFEDGISTHGRGHIARAYIFAKAMTSILEEQGVAVDRNAVLCGIAGHDVGRKGRGDDTWEQDSAETTVQKMRSLYGGSSMGEAYENAVRSCIIAGQEPQTTEAMLLHAADSLDIGRTDDFKPSLFAFLRAPNGDVSIKAGDVRKELAREADLLQRITNPYCQWRSALEHLTIEYSKASGTVAKRFGEQVDQLKALIKDAFHKETDIPSKKYLKGFEDTLRDNRNLFPLLSKYYFKD
ncbi:MAG: hypothetical protein ACI4NA_02135, partial [Succinivibrio sp.]